MKLFRQQILMIAVGLILLDWTWSHAAKYTFNGTGGDDTAAINTLISGLASGDTLVLNGNSKVSTIALWYKSNITLQINGCIESKFTAVQSSKPYAGPSGNPVIFITTGQNVTITGSYLKNTFNEAIVAFNSSFLTIRCDIMGSGQGSFDGLYINGCSNFTIENCTITNTSLVPASGYGSGNGIYMCGLNGGLISNCLIRSNGANGIYLYSGTNLLITNNRIGYNGMSGIQLNFNAAIDSTNHFTIEKNSIFGNRADGIDLNNTLSAYDVWGLVQDNYLYQNGWLNGNLTPDGSGIATCINLRQIQLLRNLTVRSARSGIYLSNCVNAYVYGNVVSKTSNSVDYGIYDQYSQNTNIEYCDVYYSSGKETLKNWYINTTQWKYVYKDLGNFVYPGWPGTYPVGMTVINTPKAEPNYYRYSTSSANDFAIRFGTPSDGYKYRVVAWTNDSNHDIILPLCGRIKVTQLGREVSYIDSVDGNITLGLLNAPQMLDVPFVDGDANGDDMVDVGDLGILAAKYGGSRKTWAEGDFNGDGWVDVGDLGILAANYGTNASNADWSADYAKVFGLTETAEDDGEDEITGSFCSELGLPLLMGLMMTGFLLITYEK
jgi:parallel beta-helix repeat protein